MRIIKGGIEMKRLGLIGLVLGAIWALPVMASDGAILGGELPVPFEKANKKVELADGEEYVLSGRVMLAQVGLKMGAQRGPVVFNIDLEEQPWLASASRVNNPFYPLQGAIEDWKDLLTAGKVKLSCIAHGVIRYIGSVPRYEIQLERVRDWSADPTVMSRQ